MLLLLLPVVVHPDSSLQVVAAVAVALAVAVAVAVAVLLATGAVLYMEALKRTLTALCRQTKVALAVVVNESRNRKCRLCRTHPATLHPELCLVMVEVMVRVMVVVRVEEVGSDESRQSTLDLGHKETR